MDIVVMVWVAVALGVFGAVLGSYACAQVWRLRARQLVEDKLAGEKVDTKEYKRLFPLTQKTGLADRSIDLDTGKPLLWYDMIPIISWLLLRGKSRYSGKPIGRLELLMEVGVAAFFVLSFVFWPAELSSWYTVAGFALWLIAGVGLAVLCAYDFKWFLLPDRYNYGIIAIGIVAAVLQSFYAHDLTAYLGSVAGSVAIFGGLYLMLYLVSRGKWIGFGDVKLGIGLGLLLGDWQLALLGLFAANLIGTLAVLPGMITKKISRGSHVPFGPFLIMGAIVAKLFGAAIIAWYVALFTL